MIRPVSGPVVNFWVRSTCANAFSYLLKRGLVMRHLIGKFFSLWVLLLGAGTAQAATTSPYPAEWWSPDGGITYPYVAPDEATLPPVGDVNGDMIRYGKQILEETYKYLGPESGLSQSYVGNQLSCSNCHLEVGRAAYGQPWAVVVKKYAGTGTWSARSNVFLTMKNRIHDCTMRSMNGTKLPDDSREMLSMVAYMEWLATGIKVADWKTITQGTSNVKVSELSPPRPADPIRGKGVYENNCASCHGYTGEGIWDADGKKYIYPAVWGDHSFNDGAGMFRLRTAVGFIKGNMPFGWANPSDTNPDPALKHQISTQDAWDSMAYILDQPRPIRAENINDWLYVRPSDCAPNWLLKVAQLDAGYESYYPRRDPATGKLSGNLAYPAKYSAARHKFGPWILPGDDMIAEMQAIQNAWIAQKPAVKPAVCPDPTAYEYTPP